MDRSGAITTTAFTLDSITNAMSDGPLATAGHITRDYDDLLLTSDDGAVQHLTFRVTVDPLSTVPTGEHRCMVEGTITPTMDPSYSF